MPEGPEIRRVADRLNRVLAGRPLADVWFAFAELKPAEIQLLSHRVTHVDSWGKALLTHFDNGQVLYSHNQLYGRWRIERREQPLSSTRSLRAALATSTHVARLYSASSISLWDEHDLPTHPFLSRLGPDLLTHDVQTDALVERLTSRRFAGRQIGSLLLDQGLVAGIGNYLRSEILFYAGLREHWRPNELSTRAITRLADMIRQITVQAWREAGVTNTPEWRAPLQAQGFRRSVWRHAVFNRAGEPCFACGTLVEKRPCNSRRLYYCPHCQS
ncbi:endonuclease VIII [Larsenimonas rhizosphaerae]|uniref:endonuclease VIII n=1 Tax=Larsenimonas rhizosphaerae TaxID=2944682 RepID=UPI002033A02A|nr:endonuclease VIII [Larsenimonas rhizosphaerae]MCM2130654.1 endonuclease VIII [Larsenimonas rhizosphaerae]